MYIYAHKLHFDIFYNIVAIFKKNVLYNILDKIINICLTKNKLL